MTSLYSPWGARPIPARIGTRRGWSLIPRWRAAPLDLTGARRLEIVVAGDPKPLARMSFSCSRDGLSQDSRSNIAEAFKASKIINSFRLLLVRHDNNHERKGEACPNQDGLDPYQNRTRS